MFWLIVSLLYAPAFTRADSLQLPPEMRSKAGEMAATVAEGYQRAREVARERAGDVSRSEVGEAVKRRAAQARDSTIGQQAIHYARRAWTALKHGGQSAAGYLDRQLHAHVLPVADSPKAR